MIRQTIRRHRQHPHRSITRPAGAVKSRFDSGIGQFPKTVKGIMTLPHLLIVVAIVFFVVAFICVASPTTVLGLVALGWIAGGLAFANLAKIVR